MAVYNTVQKTVLLDFLRSHSGEALTVKEIVTMLSGQHDCTVPSESTVYRIMRELVKSGTVKKDVNVESRENVYSLADDDNRGLSMRCRVCGNVYSVDDESSRRIKEEITKCAVGVSDGDIEFVIKCRKCRSNEE